MGPRDSRSCLKSEIERNKFLFLSQNTRLKKENMAMLSRVVNWLRWSLTYNMLGLIISVISSWYDFVYNRLVQNFFRVDEEGANPKLWIRIPRGPNFFEDCSTFHFMKTYHSLFRIDRAAQTAKPGFDWEILNKTFSFEQIYYYILNLYRIMWLWARCGAGSLFLGTFFSFSPCLHSWTYLEGSNFLFFCYNVCI